jgi:hypothetical protein
MSAETPGILYCNCTYAQVIDPAVKAAVLRKLCDSGQSFEAVADLCEMAARKDPALQRLAAGNCVKIAACYPRAVKWLFASAGAPLEATRTEVLNMRELNAAQVAERLFAEGVQPNLPVGKATAPSGVELPATAVRVNEAPAMAAPSA